MFNLTTSASKTFQGIPLSVLDLAPVNEGSDASTSFQHSVDLAQHADKLGFNRYWLAEHHGMPGIASSATSIIINHIANHTQRIRVGSGGVMLPNHASLVIAEQFGTLESMFPDRIDLGLGRAPGSDQMTAYALRRDLRQGVEEFPNQVEELQDYFAGKGIVRAVPGEGANIPIWLLGSSDFSARLSAEKGLPFSFASHFSPDYIDAALHLYRTRFKPSDDLDKPYVMLGVNIIAADTNEEARYHATSYDQQFLDLRRGMPGQLQPPIKNTSEVWSSAEAAAIALKNNSSATIIGDKETVRAKLSKFVEDTQADELIINSQIFDQQARVHSYEIVAALFD
ncbi:LLM class flavin-dependent oxidoreductase [Virgibacillus sp. 179-BFC.A HS]|uniref:LLM class flavin-dependent oxidoreductase n=1 Tax=Tigheibacillus jepli TaxID=3035914 RepID=A0ABU5CEH9_9BACI|nr:LLM class flavin-dependent oxidoreductase [Virgibacillus sp. 179-BFC.A HS]MDY0404411.1 LLM class flavin-dependent oxidoreductase [Virgibacillus sp. 179-BFC.A HS]